ncbi:hypothetical protein BBJ28_00004364 [Nothophytophthora sp. Chile5]|nr:hypothetical protein BBJ28_00004364 [Nothophytophthora sp. Chile5]
MESYQILTGENWNAVMLDGWRASGWSAVLYFISLVVLGNFIVLNLFLAILLGNFDESSDEERNIERAALKQRSRVAPTNQSSRFEQSGQSGRFEQPGRSGRFDHESAINLLMHPHFDNVSLVLIIVSTVELAIDNPLNSPDNALVNVLSWFDLILTVLFMLEVAIKIVATGFVLHDGAYLRNSWNIMDFATTAVAGFFMGQGSSKFKFVKTLRTFRALRPLRMINRNPGLKLVVSSLIASIPQILNVIMVCLLVFIIFSILAVNNLKGKFYSCQGDVFDSLLEAQQELIVTPRIWSNLTLTEQTWFSSSSAETFQSLGSNPLLLTSRVVCTLFGASWNSTIPQNFNNVISGVQTFFELTTTEGWITVMLASVDATEIDMQPVPNYREGWTFFFIAFILVGTFFVMQLFVGVVIENFNKMKEKLEGTYLLTSTQREWLAINEAMLKLRPRRKLRAPLDRTQRAFFRLAQSQNLEMVIMGCVMLNTVIMALNYFGEEDLYETTLEYSNYFFSTIFALEAIVKIIGLRRNYWKDSWNLFDFVIVLGTSCGNLYHFLGGSTVGTSASAVRSFRVGRLFRLLHSAPSLRQLFNTLLVTLPSLVNIGGLLFLVFFIYAAMGVQLFAKVKLGPLNTSSANFQTIAGAMVTLVRCSTGERWNDLMFELANQDDCVTDPSYDPNMCGFSSDVDCVPLNGCGSPVAFAYFYSFTLLVTFILLNIFIAVILEGFANEKDREDGVLLPQHLSDQPLEAMPESLNLEQQWRKYLLSRKIRKQEQSMFRVNHFNAATLLHRSVRSLIFREELRRDTRITTFSDRSLATSGMEEAVQSTKENERRSQDVIGENDKVVMAEKKGWTYLFQLIRPLHQRNSILRNYQKRLSFNSDTKAAALEFAIMLLSLAQLQSSYRSPHWTLLRLYTMELLYTAIFPYPGLERFIPGDRGELFVMLSLSVLFRTISWGQWLYFPYPIRQKEKVVSFTSNLAHDLLLVLVGCPEFSYHQFVVKKVLDEEPIKKIVTFYLLLGTISSYLLHVLETIKGECSWKLDSNSNSNSSAYVRSEDAICDELSLSDAFWTIYTTFISIGYGDISTKTTRGRALVATTACLGVCLLAMFFSIINKKFGFSSMEARVHAFLYRMELHTRKDLSAVMAVQASFRFNKSYKHSLIWHQQRGSSVFYRPLSARLPNEVKKKLYVSRFQVSLKKIMKHNTDGDPLNAFSKHVEVITAALGATFIDMTRLKKVYYRQTRVLEARKQQASHRAVSFRNPLNGRQLLPFSGEGEDITSFPAQLAMRNADVPSVRRQTLTGAIEEEAETRTAVPSTVSAAWGDEMLRKCEATMALLQRIEATSQRIQRHHAR